MSRRTASRARATLLESGTGGTSTRAVAERAGVPLSLVHYHFGSKQELLAAVLEHENELLLTRQRDLYAAPGPLAKKWRTACAFLDEEIGSGYVRVLWELWELWAAGLADQALAERPPQRRAGHSKVPATAGQDPGAEWRESRASVTASSALSVRPCSHALAKAASSRCVG